MFTMVFDIHPMPWALICHFSGFIGRSTTRLSSLAIPLRRLPRITVPQAAQGLLPTTQMAFVPLCGSPSIPLEFPVPVI